MSLKITGVGELSHRLENMAIRASEGAREALNRGANNVASLAKDYAPVDLGNLEDAIKTDSARDGHRGRKTFSVYVDENQPAENGKVVGDYALTMHEGDYNLGEGSLNKQAELGVEVGRKYLERALHDLEPKIINDVTTNIKKRIGK